MYYYAQLNQDSICVGISQLVGQVPEVNYKHPQTYNPILEQWITGEPEFVSRMVQIPVYSEVYIGLCYTDDGKWEELSMPQ